MEEGDYEDVSGGTSLKGKRTGVRLEKVPGQFLGRRVLRKGLLRSGEVKDVKIKSKRRCKTYPVRFFNE